MSVEPPGSEASTTMPTVAVVPFKRRFLVPGLVLAVVELVAVGYPLWTLFDLGDLGSDTLVRTALPVAIGAAVLWSAAVAAWLVPLWTAVGARRRGERVSKELAARAYRITLRGPIRVLVLRTGLWSGGAVLVGLFFHEYAGWPQARVVEFAALAAVHAYVVSCSRAVWWAQILGAVRGRLFAVGSPLKRFDDSHFRRFALVAMIVGGGVLGSQAAFTYYFVPLTRAQYLQLETYLPIATLIGLVGWSVVARWLTRDLRRYLAASRGDVIDPTVPAAAVIYRRGQALPYRLALLTVVVWTIVAAVGGLVARLHLGFEFDDTIILSTSLLTLAIAGAIYEQLWHREVLRPLLAHLTQRYRVPVRSIAPSLSLRSKLLLSFGGVVLLACGMALLWGFVQYKNLATDAVVRQANIGLAWVRSELQTELATSPTPPTSEAVRASLRRIAARAPEASAVMYYLDDHEELLATGGGPMGAPRPPWYIRAEIQRAGGLLIAIHPAELTGLAGRVVLTWRQRAFDLGAVAVFYPSYRGRGQSMVQPLRELVVFFLVLFAACGGIVAFTVAQFMAPIRRLEQRWRAASWPTRSPPAARATRSGG
jgi:hypothetical protein